MGDIFLNGIKYAGGVSNIFDPTIYSTTERKIGVWTDNKPLYQKVVAIPNTSVINSSFTFAHGIANIDTPMIVFAFMYLPTTHYSFQIPVISNNNEGISMRIDNQYIYFSGTNSFSANADRTMYVIVQYTKTTDVAGSGSYTTEGVPTHHYSANETVVGTWFGETLYEKSIDIGALPDNTQKQVAHNILNLKNVVEVSGYAINSTSVSIPLPYVHPLGNEYTIAVTITATTVNINTGRDRTGFTGYVTLRYTKTV